MQRSATPFRSERYRQESPSDYSVSGSTTGFQPVSESSTLSNRSSLTYFKYVTIIETILQETEP